MELVMEWIAAYYPSEFLDNKRTKTILSLLFDKVILHFPIAYIGCGVMLQSELDIS